MRLNTGLLWFLIVVAVALVAGVVLASRAPAKAASCKDADTSMRQQFPGQARSAYTAILKTSPDSACARDGMRRVAEAMCQRADLLRLGSAKEEARAAYRAILAVDVPDQNVECAIRGLAVLGPEAKSTPCPCSGLPGRDGRDGARGPRGRTGKPGHSTTYVLPCDCMTG
jgi:hypothetical protein